MVERTQIDKVIEEQGFQRSQLTESQMVRIGQILNVSKIVIGDINVVMGQYNVDARVINVETGTIAATEGATFATSSYRSSMQSVAQKLAAKIAITPGSTIQPSTPYGTRKRSSVEVLYGYLKIFPNELGVFQAEPTTVISQINAQAQHGYNNWRIPTNEELSLLRANNYLGGGEYMSRENKRGIVLLVTDGKDHKTMLVEEQERKNRFAEEERLRTLKAQGWVDMGLPSGTIWKNENEAGKSAFTYEQAIQRGCLPTKKQWQELIDNCQWTWKGDGYIVTGPNGESMNLPFTFYYRLDNYCKDITPYWCYGDVSDNYHVYIFYIKNNQQNFIQIQKNEYRMPVRLVYQ